MKSAGKTIPQQLIYEVVNGEPIYYKGYREYLQGNQTIEELMGSSKLQSLIIAELIFLLRSTLGNTYFLFTNELGLQFSKKSWRAADIAVIKADRVKELDNKYLKVPPELVIEIDTKAELSEVQNPLGYYQEKTEDLIQFGVDRVVWIFTETRKVMIADKDKHWQINNWEESFELFEGVHLNLDQMIADRTQQ
ncbi:MAG: Uma2 family endonuclease [Bacteroidota bacterium]